MKRLGILFLISILIVTFTACGSEKKVEKEEKVEKKVEEVSDSFKYDIERKDMSESEQIGDKTLSLTQYYDYVKVSGEGDVVEEVNKSLKKGYDSFIEKTDETTYYFNTDFEEIKESSDSFETTEYLNTTDAEVMQNEDYIFSIKYTSKWYLGGVYSEDYQGETYSVKTGKKLNLSEVLELSQDEAMDRVLVTVEAAINENPDSFSDNALELVEEMGIDNISFYMEEGKVYICFKTYEISYGNAGSFVFELKDKDYLEEYAEKSSDDEDDDNNDVAYYGMYLGKTVADLKLLFGDEYESDGYEGGLAISFDDPSILYIVGDSWEEVDDDMTVRSLIICEGKEILPGINSKMTFPELKEAVSDKIELDEPEYYNNEVEEDWEYSLEFSYNGYSFSYIWLEDPNNSDSDEVWVSKEQY